MLVDFKVSSGIQPGATNCGGWWYWWRITQIVRAVYCNWNADNGKWNLNCNELEDDNWNDGQQFFCSYVIILPAQCGEFLFLIQRPCANRQASCQSRSIALYSVYRQYGAGAWPPMQGSVKMK